MILAAHQPNYLPNLDFFSKMKKADIFVVATNLQTDRQGKWQMRHKISTPNGDHWMTIPTYHLYRQLIKDIKICYNKNWQRSHYLTLQNVYSNKKGSQYIQEFEDVYQKKWERLVDINFAVIKKLKEILDIDTQLILEEEISGKKHENFIKLAKKYNATTYLSGNGARGYMTKDALEEMEENGVKHIFTEKYLGPQYPYSTIHYLFTYGKEWVKNVI